jgi:orotate phosphoribosyltransferase
MPPLTELLRARTGHFLLESGHHGQLWLELECLFLQPAQVTPLATRLAALLAPLGIEMVCGPLVEGAFVALTVAVELGVPFGYAERVVGEGSGLYPVKYRLPRPLRAEVAGKRVAIVNDVINAGSAVRGTFEDLRAWGATPVAIGALLVLGDWAVGFAGDHGLRLETLESRANPIWEPGDCPLCRSGGTLEDLAAIG